MRKYIFYPPFFLLLILLYTSCRSSQSIYYTTKKAAYLSEVLKIPIVDTDPNMPLFEEVASWLGTPYRYGGNSKRGTDCSGFVSEVYQVIYGKKLERSSDDQARKNVQEIAKKHLSTGNLVFFRTQKNSKKVDHVGIFLRDGYFIHASTSKGVIVSSLSEPYYQQTWLKAGRVK